jgi:hypothetical protein
MLLLDRHGRRGSLAMTGSVPERPEFLTVGIMMKGGLEARRTPGKFPYAAV